MTSGLNLSAVWSLTSVVGTDVVAVDAAPALPAATTSAHISSTEYSRALWSAECRDGSAKMGKISSKRMPGEGKSGNWRKAARSFTLRWASSEAREAVEVVFLPLEASPLIVMLRVEFGVLSSLVMVLLSLSPVCGMCFDLF